MHILIIMILEFRKNDRNKTAIQTESKMNKISRL